MQDCFDQITMGIFKSKPKVSRHDQAILDLKIQRDKVHAFGRRLESSWAVDQQLVLKLLNAGRRDRALLVLHRRKATEASIRKCEDHLARIQGLIDQIEFARIEVDVFAGLKSGTELLRQVNSLVTLDQADSLVLDTQEALDYQQKVQQHLADLSLVADDDSSVMESLNALEAQMATASHLSTPSSAALVASRGEEEEEQLASLRIPSGAAGQGREEDSAATTSASTTSAVMHLAPVT